MCEIKHYYRHVGRVGRPDMLEQVRAGKVRFFPKKTIRLVHVVLTLFGLACHSLL